MSYYFLFPSMVALLAVSLVASPGLAQSSQEPGAVRYVLNDDEEPADDVPDANHLEASEFHAASFLQPPLARVPSMQLVTETAPPSTGRLPTNLLSQGIDRPGLGPA